MSMDQPSGLSCKEVVELVTLYLEQTLLAETRAEMDAHLAECPGCTSYLHQIQRTIVMLRALAEEPLFTETRQDLLRLFDQWKKGTPAS
jgi:anti-sigma factor RsiW